MVPHVQLPPAIPVTSTNSFSPCVVLRRGEIRPTERKLKEDRDEKKKDTNKLENISKHDWHIDGIKYRQWMASWSLSQNETQICTHTYLQIVLATNKKCLDVPLRQERESWELQRASSSVHSVANLFFSRSAGPKY